MMFAQMKKEAIKLIEKQRQAEIQMMADMKYYIDRSDKKYYKLKKNHIDRISVLDYILMKIGGNK